MTNISNVASIFEQTPRTTIEHKTNLVITIVKNKTIQKPCCPKLIQQPCHTYPSPWNFCNKK